MKKLICIALVILTASLALAGCTDKKNEPETKPTQATEQKPSTGKSELEKYLNSFTTGKNPLYGAWKIEGADYVDFVFRNDKLAEMVMGTEGDFAKLSIKTKEKTLGTQFILGLSGIYSYELSDDNNTLTLTLSGKETKLIRDRNFSMIPKAKKNPKLDKELFGWWQSEDKLVYYFGDDGIMYSNIISMETCYTYNAEKGKITAIYNYGGDVKNELKYSFKGKKLVLDGQEYKKLDKAPGAKK